MFLFRFVVVSFVRVFRLCICNMYHQTVLVRLSKTNHCYRCIQYIMSFFSYFWHNLSLSLLPPLYRLPNLNQPNVVFFSFALSFHRLYIHFYHFFKLRYTTTRLDFVGIILGCHNLIFHFFIHEIMWIRKPKR